MNLLTPSIVFLVGRPELIHFTVFPFSGFQHFRPAKPARLPYCSECKVMRLIWSRKRMISLPCLGKFPRQRFHLSLFSSDHFIFHASHSSHLFPSLHPLLICVYTLKVFIVGVAAAHLSWPASVRFYNRGWIYPSVCSKTTPPAQRITLP